MRFELKEIIRMFGREFRNPMEASGSPFKQNDSSKNRSTKMQPPQGQGPVRNPIFGEDSPAKVVTQAREYKVLIMA